MRIALADGGNPANKGDAACYLGSLEVVMRAFPDAKINFFSDNPEQAARDFGLEFVWHSKFSCPYLGLSKYLPHNKIRLAFRAFRTILWFLTKCDGFLNIYEKGSFHAKRDCDIYISKCGGNINDHYWSSMYYNLLWYWFSKREGKKVVILAQSINPIRNRLYRFLLRLVLNKMDLVTVREPHSIKALSELGVTKAHLTADLALLVNKNEPHIQIEKPAVCISVRYWKWSKSMEVYKNAIVRVANSLIAMGYHVYFLSTYWEKPYSDLWFARQLLPLVPGAKLITKEPSLGTLRSTLREFDLVIATRMHMTLLAMAQGVPCVAICYEEKAHGFFEMLGLGEYALDMEGINPSMLLRVAGSGLLCGPLISELLKENVPKLRARALENIELLRRTVYG